MKRQFLIVLGAVLVILNSAGAHIPVPAPRTGRIFQSSRNPLYPLQLVGLSFAGGILGFDPKMFIVGPVIGIGDLVCSPVYDLVNLPRDISIRCAGGVIVRVLDLDGKPVPDVGLNAFVRDAGGVFSGSSVCVGTYTTGADGTVRIPYSADQVWLAGIPGSLAAAGYEPYPRSLVSARASASKEDDGDREILIFCTRSGSLPVRWSRAATVDITADDVVDIDLQT